MRQPGTVRLLIIRQLALAVKPWLHETTANIAIWMEPRKTRPLAHDRRRIRSEEDPPRVGRSAFKHASVLFSRGRGGYVAYR